MAFRRTNDPQHAFRFLDMDEELQTTLTPIEGYENTALVSLNQTVLPLVSIVPNVQHMVQIVKVNSDEPEDGLTKDESNAIRLYTLEWHPRDSSVFYILNKTLRSSDRQLLRPWFLFLRLLLTALCHLPSASLTVYRAANMDLSAKYPKDTSVTWWGFFSCMKKSNQLEKKLFLNKSGKRTLFVIDCYSGREIHQHSMYEGEVLLPPACQFNVVNCVKKSKDLHIIELKEIQPVCDFFRGFSLSINAPMNHPTHAIDFQPVSTVSLSKKSFPAALPNPHLEERLVYLFKQRSTADLNGINLTDSDIDVVVGQLITKRQCLEMNLSNNRITGKGVAILAHTLRKNQVSDNTELQQSIFRLAACEMYPILLERTSSR